MCRANLGFISVMILTKTPLRLRITLFSAGNSACDYAPGISAIAMSHSSHVSMKRVIRMDSNEAVGEEKSSSLLMYLPCFDPLVQVQALTFPNLFSLVKFTASSTVFLTDSDRSSKFIGCMTGFPSMTPSLSYLSSLKIEAIAFLPCLAMALVADIWVKTFLKAILYPLCTVKLGVHVCKN